jgi:hypothetical protein
MPDTASTAGPPDVLAVMDHEVILRGQQYSATREPIDCVLYLSRALYHAAIDAWLDAKMSSAAGIGAIEWAGLTLRQGRAWVPTDGGPLNVLAYDAAGFSVDMEH